jgi:protease-4
MYADFTAKVAEGRGLEVAYVREIGEGRVYTGDAAVENRLVDRIATLDETIESAKRAAGIGKGRRARVVEYPKPPLFRWPQSEMPIAIRIAARALGGLARLAGLGTAGSAGAAALDAVTGGAAGTADGAGISPQPTYEEGALRAILRAPGTALVHTPAGLLPDETAPAR